MYQQATYDAFTKISSLDKHKIIQFLYEHQDEPIIEKRDIASAIEYAVKERPSFGGFVLTTTKDDEIVAAIVVNKTGMSGYGPEHILVYFATDRDSANSAVNKKLLDKTIFLTQGDIAFLVTPNAPSKAIFEKLGYQTKLLEMRYDPNSKIVASKSA